MNENRLKLNTDKTEVIYFGSRAQLNKCTLRAIDVVNDKVEPKNCVRFLGAWLDRTLTLNEHIQSRCKLAMWNICKIKNIRKYVDQDSCATLVSSLVMSRLDYSNSLLCNAVEKLVSKLQRVQNIDARLALECDKRTHIKFMLEQLHWLPIRKRIDYKVLCILFKCVIGTGPTYLSNLICKTPGCGKELRSNALS